MALKFETHNSIDEIANKLSLYYPDLKVDKKSKSLLYVRNNRIVGIIKVKDNSVSVHGDLNFKDKVIILCIIIGVLLTVVGVIIVFTILYIVYYRKINTLKKDLYNTLIS